MPVPAFNLYPPFNIVRVSHTELVVSDLAASRAFYVDTLGLQVTDEDSRQICLRAMEERGHHCLVLTKGDAPCCSYLAFRVYSEDDVDKAAAYFSDKGMAIEWVERPFQERTLRVLDPHGIPLEFYFEMERLPTIHQQYARYTGVKPLRIDHFNCFSPNVDSSVGFYNDLGFRTTEYTEDSETGHLWAAWMHRKGGVHDIAFTNGTGPRLHHIAFWVPTPMNIIDLLDVMSTTGYVDNIERGPGRHGIANASFSTFWTRMATGPKSIVRTIRRSIRTTNPSTGTSRIRSARPCGVHPPRNHGLSRARCLPAPPRARPTSRPSPL